jgi:hypothetical protein
MKTQIIANGAVFTPDNMPAGCLLSMKRINDTILKDTVQIFRVPYGGWFIQEVEDVNLKEYLLEIFAGVTFCNRKTLYFLAIKSAEGYWFDVHFKLSGINIIHPEANAQIKKFNALKINK